MRIDKTFTSKWLRASDIEDMVDEATQTAVVTINRIEMEEIGQDELEKPVIYFVGLEAGMVLNKTNAGTIKDLYGNETDEWAGKKIGLFTTEVDFQGKQVMAIRVRLKAPKTGKPKAEELFDDAEIPF